MTQAYIPIGQVKRDVSDLINRVAYGNERVVLTSRGKPKAALVSLADLAYLEQAQQSEYKDKWTALFASNDALTTRILARRNAELIDVEMLISAEHNEQGARDDRYFGD